MILRARTRERTVDVPERAEQVAVVVVARRDEGHAQRRRRDRAVDVAVDEVRMKHVGLCTADGTRDGDAQSSADVQRARDARERNSHVLEPSEETRRIAVLHLEPEEAGVEAP